MGTWPIYIETECLNVGPDPDHLVTLDEFLLSGLLCEARVGQVQVIPEREGCEVKTQVAHVLIRRAKQNLKSHLLDYLGRWLEPLESSSIVSNEFK